MVAVRGAQRRLVPVSIPRWRSLVPFAPAPAVGVRGARPREAPKRVALTLGHPERCSSRLLRGPVPQRRCASVLRASSRARTAGWGASPRTSSRSSSSSIRLAVHSNATETLDSCAGSCCASYCSAHETRRAGLSSSQEKGDTACLMVELAPASEACSGGCRTKAPATAPAGMATLPLSCIPRCAPSEGAPAGHVGGRVFGLAA